MPKKEGLLSISQSDGVWEGEGEIGWRLGDGGDGGEELGGRVGEGVGKKRAEDWERWSGRKGMKCGSGGREEKG